MVANGKEAVKVLYYVRIVGGGFQIGPSTVTGIIPAARGPKNQATSSMLPVYYSTIVHIPMRCPRPFQPFF